MGDVVQAHEPVREDLAGLKEVPQVGAREACARATGTFGSIGPRSSRAPALRSERRPSGVSALPLRARRVGTTQSNMSTPSAIAASSSDVRAEPHEVAGAVGGEFGDARAVIASIISSGSPTESPPIATPSKSSSEMKRADAPRFARRSLPERCRTAGVRRPGVRRGTAPPIDACVRSPRRGGQGGAVRDRVIKAHEDVGAEPRLVAHRVLGGHPQSRAVVRRDEDGAIIVDRARPPRG